MRKKVNANGRLYQRTKSDEVLRERRKATYMKTKRTYQAELKKAKSTSWKEYCNVASENPWSQVYKLTAGKTRECSKMTTVRKPDVTQTKSLHETAIVILYYLFTEDSGEDNLHHRNIKKVIEEPVHTDDDAEFTQEKIKNTIESFYHKKAPGLDGITGGIYQRMFHVPQNNY